MLVKESGDYLAKPLKVGPIMEETNPAAGWIPSPSSKTTPVDIPLPSLLS
jgi:hypothetical protein